VNFDSLTPDYRNAQKTRVWESVKKIIGRGNHVSDGRVLPEDESLVIGEGRRLSMAVLFLDISSFSDRPSSSREEQEILLRIINLFFTEMFRIAEDYGGTVEKNTGDGLMAYFEDSSDHGEQGSKRAVAAALTMLDINSRLLNPILIREGIAPIQFRVGVDHGNVTIARVGSAKRFNSVVAVGSTANIACKMLGKAEAGEIIIGEKVLSALPAGWLKFCELKIVDSGWIYAATGKPYPFYRYIGRWVDPV
jgi:adenylate cyclase